MPVYGQPTELNERLSSLMSAIFYNSNDLYDGIDHSVKVPPSTTPSRIRNHRPLFTEAILRKASQLGELRRKQNSLEGKSTAKASTILEVVLVANQEDCALGNHLANFISQLFAMPEDKSDSLRLEVTTVSSHAIREDLAAACSSHSTTCGECPDEVRRRRVFVALGPALQGLCLYFHQEEVMRLRHLRATTKMIPPLVSSSAFAVLAVVCVDPPNHLWKACGSSILNQMSLEGIPSLFVGYTKKDDMGVEQIRGGLGELLGDCKRHPHALALVAKDSARILRCDITAAEGTIHGLDACVWLARLITKYSESVQRIRTPPRGPPSGKTQRTDEGPRRSMPRRSML